jgi:hypothetical protein
LGRAAWRTAGPSTQFVPKFASKYLTSLTQFSLYGERLGVLKGILCFAFLFVNHKSTFHSSPSASFLSLALSSVPSACLADNLIPLRRSPTIIYSSCPPVLKLLWSFSIFGL